MMKRCGIVSREGWDVREELCSNLANVQELWCVNTVYRKRSVMCKKKEVCGLWTAVSLIIIAPPVVMELRYCQQKK